MNVGTARDRQRTSAAPSIRDTVLDIALGKRADGTWDRISMTEIASAAGVSRQTLYTHFRSRTGIAQALLSREIDRLLDGMDLRWRQARRRGTEPSDCLAAAVNWMLAASRNHPLLHDVLTGHGDEAVGASPLTSQLAPADQQVARGRGLASVVGAVTELCHRLDASGSGGQPCRLRGIEAVVRLTVSYLLVPEATAQARLQIAHAARSLVPDCPSRAHASGSVAACQRR
ncbi:TetR/AcrR family transcriptional regulator [Streptomyces prunicolor]|uniref:TetR/AcrR family transcriptional regulator n=1 Tax=Streptomyces prunicolor TaxID=67348 RepID=UPI0009987E2C